MGVWEPTNGRTNVSKTFRKKNKKESLMKFILSKWCLRAVLKWQNPIKE